MPIPTLITDLSATAASNSPSGSDAPSDGDNFLRAHGAFIKQLYDGITASAYPTLAGLADTTSAAKGDAFIGVKKTETDSVGMTLHAWVNANCVNVKEFGAVGDGSTNDTTAMQAAHATGNLVYYPAGEYVFSTITMAAGGIVGDGPGQTILRTSNTSTDDIVTFTGQYVNLDGGNPAQIGRFRDFTLSVGSGVKSAGAGIKFSTSSPTTTYSSMHVIDNVVTNYLPIGIHFGNHEFGRVVNCSFRGYTLAGIKLENTYDADMGDMAVIGNVFVSNAVATPCRAVWQLSSGGLRFIGNKILGGNIGVAVQYTAANATANLIISGNSIELCYAAAIQITRVSGTETFKNIVINGNQIALTPIGVSADSGFLSDVVISGNDFNLNSNAGNADTVCVTMNDVDSVLIGDNILRGNATGTIYGISLVDCTNVKIGVNRFETETPLVTSGGDYTIHRETVGADIVLGTTTGTSTSGYSALGSLYLSASQTVTWADLSLPDPIIAPDVSNIQLTASQANGTVSGVVISASTTSFTFYAITTSSGLAARLAVAVHAVY